MKARVFLLLTSCWLVVNSSLATVFTVINTNASGPGSLEQAMLDANSNPGPDLIAFGIASGGLSIRPTNALPVITEPVIIDGTLQPGFAGVPLIELQGTGAGTGADGLKIATSNSVIRALVINRFSGDGIEITNGNNNTVEGCYIGLSAAGSTDQGNSLNGVFINQSYSNTVGGLYASNRNYISGNTQSGINLSGVSATNNFVQGNVIGLNKASAAIANSADGVRVNAPFNVIGGNVAEAGNIISGNTGQGIEITAQGGGTVVRGNSIGLDPSGTLDRGNTTDGILVNAAQVSIGGAGTGEGNLIAGNGGDGIELNGASATNIVIQGNVIGAAGLANLDNGILITGGTSGNWIGGTGPGEANVIAFNNLDGITIAANVANVNNAIRGNVIHSNNGLGIDLGVSGVSANDANDADTGANRMQNYPVLTAATNTSSQAMIVGTLHSSPSTEFQIDVYANTLFDPTRFGEGEFHLGSLSVTTDVSGNAAFTVSFPGPLFARYLCATATDPAGNTSEFGPVLAASATLVPEVFTVINTNDSGPGSLRQAILDANASITEGPDRIHFAIPGAGPHIIAPTSALPPVVDPLIIDGYTQAGAAPNTATLSNNAVLKIRLDGNNAPDNTSGLVLWAGNSTVRGLAVTRFKNTAGHGLQVLSDANVIEGNYLGVGTDRVTDLGNGGDGVNLAGAANWIGGTAPTAQNLIAGNTGEGIEINGANATNNLVLGNLIGATGLPNSENGVLITGSARGNTIGGVEPGHANRISFNSKDGVSVAAAVANTNNVVRGNAIWSNGGLGIDLGTSGATMNDAGDADTGANGLQNFPVLTLVTTNGPGAVSVEGSLASRPSTGYTVDFYASEAVDVSGYGEGQYHLGSASLSTDPAGVVNFALDLPVSLPGRIISATATDPFGNTSEFSRWRIALSSTPPTNSMYQGADFVFIIDASTSMGGEIAAVKAGLGSFVTGLNTALIDARFAVVLFGGPPEIIQDFTADQLTTESVFDVINTSGAVAGVHENHNLNPEAGLEAVRMVLNSAGTNGLLRNNIGGAGPLEFRPNARKNLILVTDENSDLPYYVENRQPGQTGMDPPSPLNAAWQAEIDATAQAVLAHSAFLNILITPSGIIRNQYGDPAYSTSDANFLNFDPEATLTRLVNAGLGGSLEAQVLAGGLIGRAFNITSVNTTNFIENFFAAKVEEILDNPLPPPRLYIAHLPGESAVRLTWTTNSPGFLLETNRALTPPGGWGVFGSNYGVLGTNYAVTNGTTEGVRFFRLHRP